jgi:alkylhydroperoxidase/carboxymuconolactone decarboxylase family protein YurZ
MGTQIRPAEVRTRDELLANEWLMLLGRGIIQKKFGLENFGLVAPGVAQYRNDLLFRELWLRPALAPRVRSLVTVSGLTASGQAAQVSGFS